MVGRSAWRAATTPWPALVVVGAGLCVAASVSSAAESPVQETPTRIAVIGGVGPSGGKVAVPVHVNAGADVRIGAFELKLQFPSAQLTFVEVEMGGLGIGVGVKADVRTDARADQTVLTAKVVSGEKDGARTPMPDGPILQLMFKIAADLPPEAVIPMKVEVTASGMDPGAQPLSVTTDPAEIVVSNPALVGCFFYMH